jgi:eukaryotic-like serine/threonine-protein kinase
MGADAGRSDRLVAGRYLLSDVLGRGGMGTVWLATDRVLERQVALKEVAFSVDLSDEERRILRERTMREARAAARLDHPCVTTVYDVLEEEGKAWLVMEHVSARSLQELLEERGPLPPPAVARIGLDVLDALEAAHKAGIVHRDVKPANVLVGRDGHAFLTDFGIAMTTGDSSLTTQGALIGSPSYMAPERAHGDEPQPPVDLWSLGATLYAGAEGRPPFDRGEPMATLMSVVSDHPAPMLRAGPLEPVLRGLLVKDPAQRSTAAQTRRQLEAVLSDTAGVPAPPPPAATPAPAAAPPSAATPPPRTASRVPGGGVARLDIEDLRALGVASRAVLGSVARDARDQARSLADRHRERKNQSPPERREADRVATPRRRFKRRWIVVPVLVLLLVAVLVIGGVAFLLGRALGLF